jgi:hypothetical protein
LVESHQLTIKDYLLGRIRLRQLRYRGKGN